MNSDKYYEGKAYNCTNCAWYGEGIDLEISRDFKEYHCPRCDSLSVEVIEDNKFDEVDDLNRADYS